MSRQNSIPEFTDDPQSMATTLRAVKELVEGMLGQRRGQGLGAPHVFIEIQRPDPRAGLEVKKGDFWIQPIERKLYFWDGRLWQPFAP
jgi:hypothetical protein